MGCCFIAASALVGCCLSGEDLGALPQTPAIAAEISLAMVAVGGLGDLVATAAVANRKVRGTATTPRLRLPSPHDEPRPPSQRDPQASGRYGRKDPVEHARVESPDRARCVPGSSALGRAAPDTGPCPRSRDYQASRYRSAIAFAAQARQLVCFPPQWQGGAAAKAPPQSPKGFPAQPPTTAGTVTWGLGARPPGRNARRHVRAFCGQEDPRRAPGRDRTDDLPFTRRKSIIPDGPARTLIAPMTCCSFQLCSGAFQGRADRSVRLPTKVPTMPGARCPVPGARCPVPGADRFDSVVGGLLASS